MGLDHFPDHGVSPRHGVLSCMLAAAAKPQEGREWRHQHEAQFVMASLAMGGCGKVRTDSHEGIAWSQSSTWQSPIGEARPRIRDTGNTPTNVTSQRALGDLNSSKGGPRRKITPAGGNKSLGRAPRYGGRGQLPKREAKSGKGQKRKQSIRDDVGGGESRCKPSLDGIAGLASSPTWLAKAKARFEKKFYAGGTWTARASKRRRVMEIFEACGGNKSGLTPDAITAVAAALDQAQLQSAEQYLAELKWIHVESGYQWNDGLERRLTLCKRVLKRNIGPEKRAQEVKIDEIHEERWYRAVNAKRVPMRVAWSYAWACIWMLRAVEAADVLVKHVALDWGSKQVKLCIPKSKKDQEAKGVHRTLQCCMQADCQRSCPWQLAVLATSKSRGVADEPLFPDADGGKVSKPNLVKAWQVHLHPEMTGHSARRSGAMMHTRAGMDLTSVSFIGRWKSSAVFRYVSDALEEMPLNTRSNSAPTSWFGTPCPMTPRPVVQEELPKPDDQGQDLWEAGDDEETKDAKENQSREIQIVKVIHKKPSEGGQEGTTDPAHQKPMWAISKSGRLRTRHLVTQASWGLALDEWSTACGWHFAKYHVKVELTRAQLRSRLFRYEVSAEMSTANDCRAGWSKIATFDLTRFLDSKTVAANAVDLNIKLMKWRVLPGLEPERMKELRILLLGSGTLGCGVARALMGWGCRRMTFVDAGKVSFSNPVRQSLFTHKDAAEGRKKATAAREAVEAILPDAEAKDVVMDIPMPGHPHQSAEVLRANIEKLQGLVDSHDVICMLTDSRESRWLPSLLVAAAQDRETPPLGLTVALGFDSFLVSRQTYRKSHAACYFCNDVTAPSDSLAFRTLDQQCTVTRPGISGLASNVAVELLAALTQHQDGFAAPSMGTPSIAESPLGGVPHQVRGYAAEYTLSPAETEPFKHCVCCSKEVLDIYAKEGSGFLEKVVADSSILEEVSGLAEMKAAMWGQAGDVEAFDDFDDL
eukprot:s2894_g7.t1